jgi:hypothetical protein
MIFIQLRSAITRWVKTICLIAGVFVGVPGIRTARAQAGGSIAGTIKDPSGAVIEAATATVTNRALRTQVTATSDGRGFYSFPNLPVGHYDLTISHDGFEPLTRADLVIDVNGQLRVDATLEVAAQLETVTVSADAVHVEIVSTQMGEVVSAAKMTTLSLNGRSYTDLLAIQPGVVPMTTTQADSIVMAGVTGPVAPSGQLNPGNISISGQRESANGFLVNGSDVQERMNGGTSIVPNLDSIDQFRVLTSNFDAQYGNYNGGVVSVVTKSGSDAVRGNVFEFLRNSSLDAKNYFSPDRATFNQHQPGGTLGGPVRKGKLFFFADYQATRTIQGIETGVIPVPSVAERSGSFGDNVGALTGTVNGSFWADLLSRKLGYAVSPGERYYAPGCRSTAQCVFPSAIIPARAWSAPAQHLLQYIPAPDDGAGAFSTSAQAQTVRDDKGSARFDANTRLGLLSAYYFLDDYRLDNPYPTQQGGANVPGFNALTTGRAQLLAIGNNTPFVSGVNEFHFSYVRNANDVGTPVGGLGVSVASQGFVTGPGTPGIVVQAPQFEGVENVALNKLAIGVTTTGVKQLNNTFHWTDSFSRVVRTHTLRVGGEFEYAQLDIDPNAQFNGTFSFTGSETGLDFADFLLGVPSTYIQAAGAPFHLRNRYGGAFAQDSWRAGAGLTLNFGLRWDSMMPWYEKDNQIQTIVPGQRSIVYPGAPAGLVFPTDPGIPATLSPTRHTFSPRLGLAYSPAFGDGALKVLFGDAHQTSLRASFGKFYTAIPGLSGGIMYSIPPYGYNYISPAPPLFATPFITAADGTSNGQPFPHAPAPLNATAKNPYQLDWSPLTPVNGDPFYFHDNRVPYTDTYMVSIQRELARGTVLAVSYVGSQGHDLLVVQAANPGNPALCLSVNDRSQVASGSATCGPFAESGVFTTKTGQVIDGSRGPLGPDYGSVTAQKTIGRSHYNALELSLHYARSNRTVQASYTLSKSTDTSSNLGEQVSPFDPALTLAPSAFDMRHNFVLSYSYDLPLDRVFGHRNRATLGWALSGVTRLASGFPVTLYNDTDTSLLGTFGNGVNNHLLDTPNYTPGCNLDLNHDPARGPAFNASCFSLPPLGQPGNVPRRFFFGPGMENTDLALLKTFPVGVSRHLQIRLEAFNVFNHPQFYGPGAVDGNVVSASFGRIVSAAAPRLVQIGAKFTF